VRWLVIWLSGMAAIGSWDALFLNKPAFKLVVAGFGNTVLISTLVVFFTLALAWFTVLVQNTLEVRRWKVLSVLVVFMQNLVRSVPQVIGVLFGTVWVSGLVGGGALGSSLLIFCLLAFIMSIFIFIELAELMQERIQYFKTLDFYDAMRVCGISENRIVNFHILWKNSRVHIFNKLIAVFGMAIFLQCSVDFIVSVGLSTDADLVTLPPTLGGLLAKIDSKQDILALGHTLTHPAYMGKLFFKHLQGLTAAFLLVFSLLSLYHISNGFSERHSL
jgi:ABC-type dipeptide/oligopeptide/nickel transport system permease component